MVVTLKDWVDELYADGRTTVLSTKELEKKILEITDIRERKGSQSINTGSERMESWSIH